MASSNLIKVERRGALATVTLDRPVGNMFTGDMFDELANTLEALAREDELAVLVLRGAGQDFSRGRERGGRAEHALALRKELARVTRANAALQAFPGISIAVVQGRALGAGCSLAARADLVFAADTARLGFPEIKARGAPAIVIAFIGQLLPKKVAVDLIGTGREVEAAEAKSIGLVSHVVAADQLESEVQRYLDELLAKDHFALRTVKSFFNQLPDLQGTSGSEYAITLLAAIGSSR
jgi:enoyl-CoA hydratase/carnithine racemase